MKIESHQTSESIKRLMANWISEIPTTEPEKIFGCRLKEVHTEAVARTCRSLAEMHPKYAHESSFAEWIGWLHDLGRFEQFRIYGTFDDRRSEDHSLLSLKVIKTYGLDQHWDAAHRGWLRAAVRLHNRFEIPDSLPEPAAFFINLIRDADRLDIYRVFVEYYQNGPTPDSPLELGCPDTGIVTDTLCKRILSGESPSYEDARSVQEMRLIKLSWAYRLKTPGAHQAFLETGILEATKLVVPYKGLVPLVFEAVKSHCHKMISL